MITRFLAGTILILLLTVGVQQWAIQHQRAAVVEARAVASKSIEALDTANTAVAKLQLANRQCAEENAANLALSKTYLSAARDYVAKLQAEKAKNERTIQVIYEHDPSARQWADTRVPPAIADRLRAGADRPHADR